MKTKSILRLCAFALSVIVPATLALFSPRPARGSVFETLLGFGTRMAPYLDDQRTTEKPRTIILNGQKLYVAVGHTPHVGGRVKDFYLDRYHGSGEQLAQIARGLPGAPKAPATEMTYGDDDEGGLVAFDMGDKITAASLRDRYLKFVGSHRIGDLGQVRFVRWQKEPDGGTRFLTLWTDTRFSLDKLMPPRGVDAEGGDFSDVPRLPGMRRVLALDEAGKPYGTRVYEGPGSVSQIAADLGLAMAQRGWVENVRYAESSARSAQLRFDHKGRTVLLAVDEAGPGLVDVAVVERHGSES